jgi:hypothetical protein
MTTPNEEFREKCSECQEVFDIKNAEYGNAIEETGLLGASVEIIGGAARLKELVLRDPEKGANNIKSLRNVLTDLHNYAGIALMMIDKGNWHGK